MPSTLWRRMRSTEVHESDWNNVHALALRHAREINTIAGPRMAAGGSRPLASNGDFAVDVWVTKTLHAGGFDLDSRISILLQGGLIDAAINFPFHIMPVELGQRPTFTMVKELARWLDWSASYFSGYVPAPLQRNAQSRESRAYQLAVRMSAMAIGFVLAHELAHVYIANDSEQARLNPEWHTLGPRERSLHNEFLADREALRALVAWASTHDRHATKLDVVCGVWYLLSALELMEAFEPSFVPSEHPTAIERKERLRQEAAKYTTGLDAALDLVDTRMSRLTEPALHLAQGGRDAARWRIPRAIDRVTWAYGNASRVGKGDSHEGLLSQLQAGMARLSLSGPLARSLRDCQTETLQQLVQLWRDRSRGSNDPVKQAARGLLNRKMSARRIDQFMMLLLSIEGQQAQPRRRVDLSSVSSPASPTAPPTIPHKAASVRPVRPSRTTKQEGQPL